jgi:hypothetical protein
MSHLLRDLHSREPNSQMWLETAPGLTRLAYDLHKLYLVGFPHESIGLVDLATTRHGNLEVSAISQFSVKGRHTEA